MPICKDCGGEFQLGLTHSAQGWQRPAIQTLVQPVPTPPHTVLARVWLDLRGPEGPYSYAQVEAALRQAMIPPYAPYDEWANDAARALTLLPRQAP